MEASSRTEVEGNVLVQARERERSFAYTHNFDGSSNNRYRNDSNNLYTHILHRARLGSRSPAGLTNALLIC